MAATINLEEVIVRYPSPKDDGQDVLCRAIIGHSGYRPESRKRTKTGNHHAQVWHVVKWLDIPPSIYRHYSHKNSR